MGDLCTDNMVNMGPISFILQFLSCLVFSCTPQHIGHSLSNPTDSHNILYDDSEINAQIEYIE